MVYNKVTQEDVAVVELAKVCGVEPKAVAAMVNQQNYRKAYNKQKQEEMKQLRKLIKERPELLKEVK